MLPATEGAPATLDSAMRLEILLDNYHTTGGVSTPHHPNQHPNQHSHHPPAHGASHQHGHRAARSTLMQPDSSGLSIAMPPGSGGTSPSHPKKPSGISPSKAGGKMQSPRMNRAHAPGSAATLASPGGGASSGSTNFFGQAVPAGADGGGLGSPAGTAAGCAPAFPRSSLWHFPLDDKVRLVRFCEAVRSPRCTAHFG